MGTAAMAGMEVTAAATALVEQARALGVNRASSRPSDLASLYRQPLKQTEGMLQVLDPFDFTAFGKDRTCGADRWRVPGFVFCPETRR
jgi:hypothetical protein